MNFPRRADPAQKRSVCGDATAGKTLNNADVLLCSQIRVKSSRLPLICRAAHCPQYCSVVTLAAILVCFRGHKGMLAT